MTILPLHWLRDPSHSPTRATVGAYLGDATSLGDVVIETARKRAVQLVEAWHFAGSEVGWSLRLVEKARILVYLTPEESRFRIGLVLGSKALASARSSGLSAAATSIVDSAPRYTEGYGLRFHIASRADMSPVTGLLEIKRLSAPFRHDDD